MKNNFSKNARTWRLAGTYLAVMMVFSTVFSLAMFAIFWQNLSRPIPPQKSFSSTSSELRQFSEEFETQISERDKSAIESVILGLVLMNFAILLGGAWFSWVLARWTLRPIEENFERQSQFVSDASHELRTPLAAMLVCNEVALRKKILTEEKSRAVFEKNIAEIRNLTSLTENLLNLASENPKKKIEKFRAKNIVKEVVLGISTEATKKKIALASSGEDFEIRTNLVAVRQILKIFAENAVKYSPEKSSIKICFSKNKKFAIFEVLDQGEGIPKEDFGRIFERFYRSNSARTRGENSGHGLGLAIAKNLAEQNNFEISVDSEMKKGSKFSLKIHQ